MPLLIPPVGIPKTSCWSLNAMSESVRKQKEPSSRWKNAIWYVKYVPSLCVVDVCFISNRHGQIRSENKGSNERFTMA